MTRETLPLGPVGIWTGALEFVPARRSQELAAEIESLGYGALWIPEVAGRDPFVQLSLVLSATTSLIGATGIANIWARDAVTMTGAAKGLTEPFPERMLLGLGVSHHTLVESLRGHRYVRPLAAMRSYLEAMDAAPYTSARPTTPLRRVLAALGPKMLQLAAETTDGAHPYFVTPEHTVEARRVLGPDALLCPEQAVILETDPDRARAVARTHTKVYLALPNYVNNLVRLGFPTEELTDGGSDRVVDAIVAWGDVERIAERVQAHLDAGADHVCIQALTGASRATPEDQWRALAPRLTALHATSTS